MWLLKTSSGKIARTPNLDKYQAEFGERAIPGAASTGSDERRASVVEVFAWSAASAIAIYAYALVFYLGDSVSWNVYAGF